MASGIPIQPSQEPMPPSSEIPPRWSKPLLSTLAALDKTGARVIGVASDRPNAGVSTITRRLSDTYLSFGRRTQLIDAVELVQVLEGDDPSAEICGEELKRQFEAAYSQAAATHDYVLVDLPPAIDPHGKPTPGFMSGGSACDVVLLVCLTAVMTRAEVTRLVDNCRISNVKIGAVILNDRNLPLSSMLG
jgi:Mrp family chromosome partitioning ATPase